MLELEIMTGRAHEADRTRVDEQRRPVVAAFGGHATPAGKNQSTATGAAKASKNIERPVIIDSTGIPATSLSAGLAEIPKPRAAFRDLVRPRQAAALAGRAPEIRKADR